MSAIDEIKERLDIVDIVQENGVALRRTGRSYLGFCPFHSNTRTPAFTVYPDTQSFYCFGCQASGTVFDFVMRKQGWDFREAMQQLAPRAGVELKPKTEEETQQDQQRTRLLALNALAARYFNYLLLSHPRGEPGRDYLAQRAIHTDTQEIFQLGYSMNERTHLLRYLTERKGYPPEEIEAAGLISHSEQHGWYDRFRGRLIFPIRNSKGEVVGFGGRALGDMQPKYLNTPQTVLFDKSRVLYGLDLARDSIRSADATVIVEGYVDVITAHQHGFRNVVAPLGTALTTSHVDMIKKLTHHVYLALDADAAGQRATLRGLSAFEGAPDEETAGEAQPVVTAHGLVRWQRDVTLRIIKMPPGRDPDDVIKSDPQQWQALLDAAQPVMEFYIDAYTADLDLSQPQQQRTALERLIPLVRQLDSTQQRVYVARLERVIGIRAELILDLLRASPQQRQQRKGERKARQQQPAATSQQPPANNAPAAPKRKNGVVQRENYLLALLFRHPSALRPVEMVLNHELQSFTNLHGLLGDSIEQLLEQTANRQVWQAWQAADMPVISAVAEGHMPDWAQPLDAALQAQLETVATVPVPEHQEYRYVQDAENCVRYLRREQVRRWQRRLSQQAQDSDDPQAREQATALLSELQGYLARVNIPRRNSSWTDVRDTLQRPDD